MKMFNDYDTDYIKNLVVYPAWDGPQIVFMIDWENVGVLNFKIIRNSLTFPESISSGEEVLDDNVSHPNVYLYNDMVGVVENQWQYYSIFLNTGTWERIATVECFSFGLNWAKEEIWNYHLPDIPFKVDDKKTSKRIIRESYFNHDGGNISSPISDDVDPQLVFVTEEDNGYQHQLERYIKYLAYEVDKYADLVYCYPKLFRIDTMPIFMLDLVSELVKMEFKYDFSPIYKRQLIRFSVPRAKRKGTSVIIRWISRLISQIKDVYIQEFGDNVLYWTDVGNAKDMNDNDNDVVTESIGSFWHGENISGDVFGCFSKGSYLVDDTEQRIYSPYVYGIYIFFNVEIPVYSSTLCVLNHYIERNIAWLNKWFTVLVQKTTQVHNDDVNHDIKIETNWRDLDYNIVCWTFEDTGWTDPFSVLP